MVSPLVRSSPGPVVRVGVLSGDIALCSWARLSFKVAPYSFLTARELISKISRWRELSNSMPKSRAKSRSKMPTKMASKLLKFVYRK